MHPLERTTLDRLKQNGLLLPAEKNIVVGVSGGADSVALLHVLSALRNSLALTIVAVYVDHGLRPRETEAETEHVRSLAGILRTGFEAVRVATKEYARAKKLSIEHAARDLRYEALRNVAASHRADCIAVAHTADDQAEEILIRLLRGGGRKSLAGMRSRTHDIIRPFLQVEKSTILGYLQDRNISHCEDSMNADLRFLRNRVRLRLLPYLEQNFDRGVRRSLCKTADSLAEDEALLAELTDNAYDEVVQSVSRDANTLCTRIILDRRCLLEKPVALQRRLVEKLLWQVGGKAAYTHILKIIAAAAGGRTGTEIHLSRGLRVGVQKAYVELVFPRGKRSWRGRLYSK